jgi:hypothetical protein
MNDTPAPAIPATDLRVAHISLVFREMWDTDALNLQLSVSDRKLR